MSQLSTQDIIKVAENAGFSGESLAIAVSIALAESGGNTTARNENGPTQGCPQGSTDRGLWQINNCYHEEVSDICADTPSCCAVAAYHISNSGTNFHPWSTFLNGAYLQHLDAVKQAIATMPQPEPASIQNQQQANQAELDIRQDIKDLQEWVLNHPTQETNVVPAYPHHYHTVSGDTLWGIALMFYGDGNKWQNIYDANKSVIGNNPNILQPNLTITIP